MKVSAVLDALGRELRYALRTLPRRPTFALAAVLTLAIGIGATTAIFSVVYSVLIKPLPYPNSEELVRIRHGAETLNVDDLRTSSTMYLTYRDENRTFANVGLWTDGGETLADSDGTDRVRSLRVTHGLLQALGVQPLLGRWFAEEEHFPAAERSNPVILSYGFWQSRFAGDATMLGRELLINSRPAEVVGIMPPEFSFLDLTPQPDVIVPIWLDPARESIASFNFNALGRLRSGVSAADARADIERMLPLWLDEWPIRPGFSLTREAIENWRITPVVRSLKDDLVGPVSGALWVLMGAIGGVLLIACANIANLMLVRADARRQEFAVRAALGAVPARIARELIVESLVIGGLGGTIGLILAGVGLDYLVAVGPTNMPRLGEVSIHPPVLMFTLILALVTSLAFGSITAIKHALRFDTTSFGGTRGASTSRERNRTRSALVVVQVALAFVLIVSAALMLRTFQAMRSVDPGMSDLTTIQTVRTWVPRELFSEARQYTQMQREIADAIAALPGVDSAAFTSTLPIEGPPFNFDAPVVIDGRPPATGDAPPSRRVKLVSPGYFQTMGTRIIAGRDVTWDDIEAGGRVALISEDFAREFGPEPADALGARLRTPVDSDAWREVVGIVQSVKEDAAYARAPNLVYWPAFMEDAFGGPEFGAATAAFIIRSDRAGTASFVNEIRQAVWSVNAEVPVALERTMQDLYAGSLGRTSFALVMLAIAGSMALLLGIIGIYGVIAYVVAQRTREIGIRIALGAQRRQVRTMFLQHGLTLSAAGIAVGLVIALALTRLMTSLLFEVAPTDIVTYIAAFVAILSAAALASYLPARRASSIDPVNTLNTE